MEAILQLRTDILLNRLDRAIRQMEQVLSASTIGNVNGLTRSVGDLPRHVGGLPRPVGVYASDLKAVREREATFMKVIDDNHKLIDKICKSHYKQREDREDLYQEIVYQLWNQYPSFKGQSKLSTWIYKVALRTAVIPIRRKKSVEMELQEVLPDGPAAEPIELARERVFTMFKDLGKQEGAILALLMEGHTVEEIGRILFLEQRTLYRYMRRAKNELQYFLRNNTAL